MVLCDSFNMPLICMADQPGFLVGKEGERLVVTGKVMNWLNAMCLASVPKIALVLRKTGVYTAQAVIDPRATRDYLIRMLEVHQPRSSGGIGEHLMHTWPTTH